VPCFSPDKASPPLFRRNRDTLPLERPSLCFCQIWLPHFSALRFQGSVLLPTFTKGPVQPRWSSKVGLTRTNEPTPRTHLISPSQDYGKGMLPFLRAEQRVLLCHLGFCPPVSRMTPCSGATLVVSPSCCRYSFCLPALNDSDGERIEAFFFFFFLCATPVGNFPDRPAPEFPTFLVFALY